MVGTWLLLPVSVNWHFVIKDSSVNSDFKCFIIAIVETKTQLSEWMRDSLFICIYSDSQLQVTMA